MATVCLPLWAKSYGWMYRSPSLSVTVNCNSKNVTILSWLDELSNIPNCTVYKSCELEWNYTVRMIGLKVAIVTPEDIFQNGGHFAK
jgi:hypothetical protein